MVGTPPPRHRESRAPASRRHHSTHSQTVALCFLNFGPYHRARLRVCCDDEHRLNVLGFEIARAQAEYRWKSEAADRVISVFDERSIESLPPAGFCKPVHRKLEELDPQVCAVAGYSHPAMLAVIHWCCIKRVPWVLLSDSKSNDAPRTGVREWLKTRIVRLSASGLVAGTPHRNYLMDLGMPRERIFLGYDAVDNCHFAAGVATVRIAEREAKDRGELSEMRTRHALPSCYFLASARFIEKKNLPRLIDAYARYRRLVHRAARESRDRAWDLVLLGDGPLRHALRSQLKALELEACVHLPGFIQYEELPVYYGLAETFVHASTTEQWGLVVNEAMASGLPVLVSNRCGCASDLVKEGVNGISFDPYRTEVLAQLMLCIASMKEAERSQMGRASRDIIRDWGPDRFARGLREAVECAARAGPPRARLRDHLLLRALMLR
jgi:1,2-diacylglycerol 3-alpha-glucosyltransferase